MMPERPYAILHLSDCLNELKVWKISKVEELMSLWEGDVVEIFLPGETDPKYYVLEKCYNYLYTRGYMEYVLIRGCKKKK
jgi:hypothetical protein